MAWRGAPDLRQILLATIPVLSTLFCVLLGISPVFGQTLGILAPPLFLATIFFWALSHPDLMPTPLAFAIGLFFDLISGAPLALWAMISTLVAMIAHNQTRILPSTPFLIAWFGFAVAAAAACFLAWLLVSIGRLAIVPVFPVAAQAGLLVAFYPFCAYLCGLIQHRLLVGRNTLGK